MLPLWFWAGAGGLNGVILAACGLTYQDWRFWVLIVWMTLLIAVAAALEK